MSAETVDEKKTKPEKISVRLALILLGMWTLMEKAVCKFLLLYALKYLKKIICNIEIFTCNLFLKQPEKAFYMILCFRVFKITLSVKFKVEFEYFQEHKMASVRDDMDMNPVMMDNPVFATGSSVNLFCPLCHEMFNNPRLLPCLHTFCKRCLENLVVPRSSTLSCPACRTDVQLTVRFSDFLLPFIHFKTTQY